MTIDMHSHWKSSELAEAMRARTVPPRIVRDDDGVEVLATMEGVELYPMHLADGDLPDEDAAPSSWTSMTGLAPDTAAGFLVLPEPFTFAADRLVSGLDYAYPGVPKVGGLASGARQPGGHSLFLNRACHHSGAILLGLSGNVVLETVVAQGCKPFGKVGHITGAEAQYITNVMDRIVCDLHSTGAQAINKDAGGLSIRSLALLTHRDSYSSSLTMTKSTRRFLVRPASVALVSIGRVSPKPLASRRIFGTPCLIK